MGKLMKGEKTKPAGRGMMMPGGGLQKSALSTKAVKSEGGMGTPLKALFKDEEEDGDSSGGGSAALSLQHVEAWIRAQPG